MNLIQKSKQLAYLLRHAKDLGSKHGIEMSEDGYVSVAAILVVLNISKEELIKIVETNNKKRFKFNTSGFKIKANQGHSVKVDLKLEPAKPPEFLYHGTATRFMPSIESGGLNRMKRHHVHLSDNLFTAKTVGKRHGKLIVLAISAESMYNDGAVFYKTENGVWLTDKVPRKYIEDIK